ncbi:Thiosulfate sulfurtransferase GlpE [uncultured archaeon]|nr:Thiosulfate sulfurtransferase GlpE [uncultured archaeon]
MAELLKSQPERPPYFRRMEQVNLDGVPLLGAKAAMPVLDMLSPAAFEAVIEKALGDVQILDTRQELGFAAAHIPNALSIWQDGLASFAGWFLSYTSPILLVTEKHDADATVRTLIRQGYDNIAGCLAGGMLSWHMSGRSSAAIRTLTVQDLCSLLDQGEHLWILDVRSAGELERDGQITGATHIHITQISLRSQEVPKDRTVYVFCGSGMRSMIAASYLQSRGWSDLVVILGGMSGWRSRRCPLRRS